MKIVNLPIKTDIYNIKCGQVFKYEGKYYMATDAYYGPTMSQKNRVYVELATGFWKSFTDELVEPIEDIRMVVGQGAISEEDE